MRRTFPLVPDRQPDRGLIYVCARRTGTGMIGRLMLAVTLASGLGSDARADDFAADQKKPAKTAIDRPAMRNQPGKPKQAAQSAQRHGDVKLAQHEESSPAKGIAAVDAEPAAKPATLEVPSPASDPAWPTWTATDNLGRQPVAPQIGYYDLVRPPYGVAPDEYGQEYQRHVASEADLDFNDATCAQPIDIYRPDGVAPAGVIGDHTLNTLGRVMFSYRYNYSRFDGMLSGTNSISTASALTQFPIVPVNGTTETHLVMMEYGVSDDLTFQAMLPFLQRNYNYVDALGNHYTTGMTDPGDVSLYALYVIQRSENQQIHLNMGVQIPLGIFIDQGDTTTPNSPALTYPVRSSDGTWDFLPGITYRGQSDDWTWGLQGLGIVRFGINKFGYRLGDEGNFNAWLARKLTNSVSISTRLNAQVNGNIFGADEQLNPNVIPSNRTNLQAGQQLNILFGLNYVIPEGFLRGQRLGVEGGLPIYQWLEGPQIQQQYQIWTNLTILF